MTLRTSPLFGSLEDLISFSQIAVCAKALQILKSGMTTLGKWVLVINMENNTSFRGRTPTAEDTAELITLEHFEPQPKWDCSFLFVSNLDSGL